MTKKIKILISAGSLLAVALLVGFSMANPRAAQRNTLTEENTRTVILEQGDIRSTVSSTGTIYSTDSVNVYSSLNYKIKTIPVSVGDRVNAGDVLAELDVSGLELDIAQRKAQVGSTESSTNQSLKVAQNDLATYEKNLKDNMDSALVTAEKAVATAEANLASAKLDIENVNIDLATARRNYKDAKDGKDELDYNDDELRTLRNAQTKQEIALEKAENALENRKADLEKAKTDLEIARNTSQKTLQGYQDKVTSAQISGNHNADYIAIQKLENDLANCVITAPVSGVITSVKAVEGAPGNGLLFVIQDTDNLKVVSKVKEYDIGNIKEGDKVIVKTDATNEKEFEGTLSKIAPTSTLTATGDSVSSTDAEFEVEVTVNGDAHGLLIGMNARLNIITEEKTGVFSVPFEAVGEEADGSKYVYEFVSAGDGNSCNKIPVQTGLETNIYIEITGDGLTQGMKIVKNAAAIDPSVVQPANQGGTAQPQAEAGSDSSEESSAESESSKEM